MTNVFFIVWSIVFASSTLTSTNAVSQNSGSV